MAAREMLAASSDLDERERLPKRTGACKFRFALSGAVSIVHTLHGTVGATPAFIGASNIQHGGRRPRRRAIVEV
jgi:hypothetical protein